MLQDFDFSKITEPLLAWYAGHARILPWREQITPYRVWVSEIMLQQTRVEAVKPYFERFMAALPSIKDLAVCPEDRLLKLWEGLGYYNRVRNLQAAAREVMETYHGELPADYGKLLSLKGIGRYTAGAICSIAYGIPAPAVDGNVLRVIMRVCADDSDIMKQSVKNRVEQTLLPVIPPDRAAAFTQALMELGATVCLPTGEPRCPECPWASFCEAKKQGIADRLPRKSKTAKRRIEDHTVLLIRDGGKNCPPEAPPARPLSRDVRVSSSPWPADRKGSPAGGPRSAPAPAPYPEACRRQAYFFPCGMAYERIYDPRGFPDPGFIRHAVRGASGRPGTLSHPLRLCGLHRLSVFRTANGGLGSRRLPAAGDTSGQWQHSPPGHKEEADAGAPALHEKDL